jgi:hypothetical protein
MEVRIDYGAEPVRKDLGLLLVLFAALPFGILMWWGLFFAIEQSVLAAWEAVVTVVA